MFKPKRILLFFSTFLLLIFIPLLFAEETVTITTYYPSPYGVYSSLQVDKLGVGDNSGDNILNSADVPTTSGNAWIKGSVGIGTADPGSYKLNVAGTINSSDVYIGALGKLASQITLVAYGGSYLVSSGAISGCTNPNIVTGDCSCPSGFTARRSSLGAYYHYNPWDTIYEGYSCEKYP